MSANQSIINIRSETDLQSPKNVRKFEFSGHGLRINLKAAFLNEHRKTAPELTTKGIYFS